MAVDNLWELIHNLSTQEKRYFSRDYVQWESNQEAPLYLQLFDVICKQNTYNEVELICKLSPGLNKKNISYTKNYLYDQLSSALIKFNSSNDIEAIITKQLNLIKILREKGLYKQALKIWDKAIGKARDIEHFPLILQLKEEFRKIQLYNNPKITQSELQKVYSNNLLYIAEFTDLVRLQEINFSAQLLRKKTHFKLTDEEQELALSLLSDPVLQVPPQNNSFSMWHYYNMSKATLLYLLNDVLAYDYALKNILAWQDQTKHISYDQDSYIEVLYIYYYAAVLSKDISKIESIMMHPANGTFKSDTHKAYFEVIKHLALNRVYNRMGAYEKVALVVAQIKLNVDRWKQHVNIELIRTLYLSAGIAFFALRQFEESYYFVKQSLLLFNDQSRQEQFSFAYLFLLLICYERKEPYLFELQYKSSNAYFNRNKAALTFEKVTLQRLYKAFHAKSFKEKSLQLSMLLEELIKNENDLIQIQVFNLFNIPGWIQSKLQKVDYRDWVLKKVQAQGSG